VDLSCGIVSQQPHGEKFANKGPCVADTNCARIELAIFLELEAVGQQGIQGGPGGLGVSYFLLYRLDEKLGDLRGSQLVPGKRRLNFANDEQANAVLQVIDGDSVCHSQKVAPRENWRGCIGT